MIPTHETLFDFLVLMGLVAWFGCYVAWLESKYEKPLR